MASVNWQARFVCASCTAFSLEETREESSYHGGKRCLEIRSGADINARAWSFFSFECFDTARHLTAPKFTKLSLGEATTILTLGVRNRLQPSQRRDVGAVVPLNENVLCPRKLSMTCTLKSNAPAM